MVEFALVLPLLLLFFVASIEIFRLNQIRHAADNAAYEACRRAIVPGANKAEAIAEAQRLLGIVGIKNATIRCNPATLTESTPSLTVHVEVPAKGNVWITPRFSSSTVVDATSTLMTERNPAIQAAAVPAPIKK